MSLTDLSTDSDEPDYIVYARKNRETLERLAEEDDELGPVFEALLQEVEPE